MTQDINLKDSLARAALTQLDGKTWPELTLGAICKGANLTLAELPANIDKAKIGYRIPRLFDAPMRAFAPNAHDAGTDQLFDALMVRYEAMEAVRGGLAAYLAFANRSPLARVMLSQGRYITAKTALTIAGLDHSTDLPLPLKVKLLTLTVRKADMAWRDEENAVYSKTMVALQEGIDAFDARVRRWGKSPKAASKTTTPKPNVSPENDVDIEMAR